MVLWLRDSHGVSTILVFESSCVGNQLNPNDAHTARSTFFSRCKTCPAGAICLGGATVLAEEGWWQGDDFKFYQCLDNSCCPSGGCVKNASDACIPGRQPSSALCAGCSDGLTLW